MQLKAVIFDFDGTLTKQGSIDFNMIRNKISCPPHKPILDYIETLCGKEKKAARDTLDSLEFHGAESSEEEYYAEEVIGFLNRRNIPVIIITRNSKKCILRSLENFRTLNEKNFYRIISRDDPYAVKPDPQSIIHIAGELDISTGNIMVIGDYIHDMTAGIKAGAKTVYKITDRENDDLVQSDYIIQSLRELLPIFSASLPLQKGKYPNDLLGDLLTDLDSSDSRLIIGPGVGEDSAVINAEEEELIILKSDPITFPVDDISMYSINVNMNDIVTSGGTGQWMTLVLLFPEGTYPEEIEKVMESISHICRKRNLSICGGHTEITDAVNRPVISVTIIGTVSKEKLINKKNIHCGDSIILSKFIGIEGSSIIAAGKYRELIEAGFNKKELESCKALVNILSISEEAQLAVEAGGVSAMHDVTEGGIATAIGELSLAGKKGFDIYTDQIPILEITKRICSYFKINPLGLIGSGSLIIICRKEATEKILYKLQNNNIEAGIIGKVNSDPGGKISCLGGALDEWPEFTTDELTKIKFN